MSSDNKMNDFPYIGNGIERQHNSDESGDNGIKGYVYRDRSHISPTQTDLEAIQRDRDTHHFAQRLPTKLNRMLQDPELSGVIEWMPHGRSWRIIDRDEFRARALPTYFQHSNMASFIRLVNAWGFRRVQFGVDYDSYYHELFLRGKQHLHVQMRRLLQDERKAPPEPSNGCSDFYDMPVCGGDDTAMSSSIEESFDSHPQGLSSTTLASTPHRSSGSSSEVVAPPLQSISSNKNNSTQRQLHKRDASITATNPIRNNQFIIIQSNLDFPGLSTVPNANSTRSPNYHWNGPVSFSQVERQPISYSVSPGQLQLLASSRHQPRPSNSLPSNQARSPQIASASTNPTNPNNTNQPSHRDSQAITRDPVISFLANILFPRVQIFGPPRTNEDLVSLLISEWHASPEISGDDDYQRLQQILIARHFWQQQQQRSLPPSQQDAHEREK